MAYKFEEFEKKSIETVKTEAIEKMKELNKAFDSAIEANDGFYGIKTIDKGDGYTIEVGSNEAGQLSKEYYKDGKLLQRTIKVNDGLWEKAIFDENGKACIKEALKFENNIPKDFKHMLAADAGIVKTAVKGNIENFIPVNEGAIEAGKNKAMIAFADSAISNAGRFAAGEISSWQMVANIAKETAKSGAGEYKAFISEAAHNQMKDYGEKMIGQLRDSEIPNEVIDFGLELYGDIGELANGKIDFKELLEKLEDSNACINHTINGAKKGYDVGNSLPVPYGGVAGGVVGGVGGFVLSTGAYETAMERGSEGAHILANKAQKFATGTYESAKEIVPEKAASIKALMLDYASKAKLHITL